MSQQLRLLDSMLGVLWEAELTEPEAVKTSLDCVDYVFRQLGDVDKQDDLNSVKFLCQLYEHWYRVSTKHLTFAHDCSDEIDGIDRVRDIQAMYTRFAEVIGAVRQKIAAYEIEAEGLLGEVASDLFAMTH